MMYNLNNNNGNKNKRNDTHVILCKRGLLSVKLQEYGKALEDFCYAYMVDQNFYFDYETEEKNGDVWKDVSNFLERLKKDSEYWNVIKKLLENDKRIKQYCNIWKSLKQPSERMHIIIIKGSDEKKEHYRKMTCEIQKIQEKEVKNEKKAKTEQQGKNTQKKKEQDVMARYFKAFISNMKWHYKMKAKKYNKDNNKTEKMKIQMTQKF